jgi:hypothetical protein
MASFVLFAPYAVTASFNARPENGSYRNRVDLYYELRSDTSSQTV